MVSPPLKCPKITKIVLSSHAYNCNNTFITNCSSFFSLQRLMASQNRISMMEWDQDDEESDEE
jgi:hypothetical protein